MSLPFSPNDPRLKSFIDVEPGSHFPIQNLPFGIFSEPGSSARRVGVAIGDCILDLAVLASEGLLRTAPPSVFSCASLNAFLASGRPAWRATRLRISELLSDDCPSLRDDAALRRRCLVPMNAAELHLPVDVGGYSDFMSSREHSRNCMEILGQSAGAELWPNWHHLPIAYNGRASTVVVSGTPVRRPWGQMRAAGDKAPVHAVSTQLDFELEVALVVGVPNQHGRPIPIAAAGEHAFGLVLLNDWSVRDVQAWEAQPLGPFNSKNVATSISPWIVTLDALEPFRAPGPEQLPVPLPYLRQAGPRAFRVLLEAVVRPAGARLGSVVSRCSLDTMYWSLAQLLVHQTSSGCSVRPGDLLGSGTVSQGDAGTMGCLFEMTRGGRSPVSLEQGGTRIYLEDGDEVVLSGWCQGDGYRVGFGTCAGTVLPAWSAQEVGLNLGR